MRFICKKCGFENIDNNSRCLNCGQYSGKMEPSVMYGLKMELLDRGLNFMEECRYEEAIECFDKAMEIPPLLNLLLSEKDYKRFLRCRTLEEKPLLTDPMIYKGIALSKLHEFDEAISCFEKVLIVDPVNYKAWVYKGSVLCEKGDYEKSLEVYNLAGQILPGKIDIINTYREDLLERIRKYEEIIIHYDNMLDFMPSSAAVWNEKGEALLAIKRYEEALLCFNKAIEMDSECVIAWYNRGVALHAKKDYKEAISSFDRVLKMDINCISALYCKAIVLACNTEDYGEALSCYDRILEIEPALISYLPGRGEILFKLEKYEEALECFNRILEVNPCHPLAEKGRIETLKALKKK